MLIILVFIIGYLAIALEDKIKVNKAASAILTGVICWVINIMQSNIPHQVNESLNIHLGEISSILFFLLGAMTIVELIDSYDGFDFITNLIKTNSLQKLILIVSLITFFLSAILDNLTTAIVMISICSKLLTRKEDKLWMAGVIIISANAGGAWSPLGDVTTTMLWIGGQITALSIMQKLFIPSILVCLIPTFIISNRFKKYELNKDNQINNNQRVELYSKMILFIGIGLLLFVPIFKTITHLPPYMGILFALSIIWILNSLIFKKKIEDNSHKYTVNEALKKIDIPSILFFLGILLAVSALQSSGTLNQLAVQLALYLKNEYLIGIAFGLLSSILDNVPLVAAVQGMYPLSQYPADHIFWEFIALTTGTGGSIIIIGSAAGVAIMGIEDIDFFWYLKNISLLALIGFIVGIVCYILMQQF